MGYMFDSHGDSPGPFPVSYGSHITVGAHTGDCHQVLICVCMCVSMCVCACMSLPVCVCVYSMSVYAHMFPCIHIWKAEVNFEVIPQTQSFLGL